MIRPRKQLPIPDGDAPKSGGRPPPPLPSDDNDPPPPVPGRRPPPPVPEPEKHSDSSYESDSDFDADSDESYEKMRDKLSPPAIPNRGYRQSAQQREDFHSPMAQPRSSRAPPPGRSHDSSPRPPPPSRVLPNLPPTPGKRGVPQPPIKPDEQEVYDDGEAGDIYEEDVEVGEPEDFYDDGEVGQEVYNDLEDTPPPIPAAPRRNLPPPPPQTGRPPLPQEPQDVYEVEPEPDPIPAQPTPEESGESIYEMEPTVSDDQPSKPPPQLPNRPRAVPAPPQETYEIQDDEQENYDEFDVADSQETYDEFEQGPGEVYEDVNDDDTPKLPGRHVPPPPPAPAPLKSTPPPPKTKAPPVSKPTPKPPIGGGPGGIDFSAITAVKLKKVGVPTEDRPKASETEKIYDEDGGVKSAFEKFKLKESSVNQVDFRSLLSKPKISPKDNGNKPSPAKPAATTALVPPVSKWGQNRNQGDQSLQTSSNFSKSLPSVPHKPLDDEHTVKTQKSPPSLPFKPKHSDSHPLPGIPTPTVRLSPLPDPSHKREVPVPPRHPSPNHDTPPIPAARRSPSPSKDSAPPPPPIKSVPDKPPAVPYTQVKPHTSVTNGNKLGVQEDPISSDDEDDDIYDDAISNRDPLLGEPWYFKSLKDRKTGDKLLKKVGKDGTFLIRESTKQGNFQPYTMMVLYQNNIYNLKIRVRSDGKMALGEEKPDEMSFMDVQKLVKYHRETEVILVGNTGQHKTLLKYSPPHD